MEPFEHAQKLLELHLKRNHPVVPSPIIQQKFVSPPKPVAPTPVSRPPPVVSRDEFHVVGGLPLSVTIDGVVKSLGINPLDIAVVENEAGKLTGSFCSNCNIKGVE